MDGNPLLDRWDEIDALFNAALDLPAAEREAFVRDSTCGDEELLDAVLALLQSSEQTDGFLEQPHLLLQEGLSCDEPEAAPIEGQRLGPYRLLEEVGRGGTGTVYLAERADGAFEQRVAVKLLRRGLDTDDIMQRFRAERQILASLNHPNVARLLDGGATEDERPYLVMELVEGLPITEHCDRHRLGVEERLRLFATVGRAVQYAHRNLVIHRDLKPSNILVADDGTVKLLDFGIAKLLDDAAHPGTTPFTRTGLRLMTPEYASPEQVQGEAVTTASDVYQLGVLLYELLAGQRPYELRRRSAGEVERVILTQEPLPPSALATRQREAEVKGLAVPAVTWLARWRGSDVRRLRSRLRGDLDTIALMALRKEPERRYASVAELVEDVERHLRGLPVTARADTWGYRTRKHMRRNPGAVVVAVLGVLAVGGYIGTLQAHAERLERERDRAETALERAEIETAKAGQVTSFLTRLFEDADPANARGAELTVREVLDRGLERVEELPNDPEVRAELLSVMARVYRSLGVYDSALSLVQQALTLRQQLHGDMHVSVVADLRLLGATLYSKGDFHAAEQVQRKAVGIARELQGNEHPVVAENLETLAMTLRRMGSLDEGVAALKEAVEIRRKQQHTEPIEVASSLHSLGTLLWMEYDYHGALQAHREQVEILRRLDGDNHLTLASALHSLGMQLLNTDDPAGAEAAFREAIAIRQPVLGRDNNVRASMNLLGIALREQRKYECSEQILRVNLEIETRLFGKENLRVSAAHVSLGLTLLEKGDYNGAEFSFLQSLAILRRSGGEDLPHIGQVFTNLGRVESGRGNLTRAEELHREGLRRNRAAFGEFPIIALGMNFLGEVLRESGSLRESEELHRDALEILRKTLRRDNAEVAVSLHNLGAVLRAKGSHDAAEHTYHEGLALRRQLLGEKHPSVAATLEGLGLVSRDRGQYTTAATYLQDALDIRLEAFGEDHPEVARTRGNLKEIQGRMEVNRPGIARGSNS